VTVYASAYRASGMLTTGQKLYVEWQKCMRRFKLGDEYDLVDAFAQELTVQQLAHVYRVLSTRGMKGTYFYFLDEETRRHFEELAQ
jgi:hypothetical protein